MLTPNDNAILDHLGRLIAAGRPGERLPSVRSLQGSFRVSPLTVERIFRRLRHDGLIETRPGDGTFIAQPPANDDQHSREGAPADTSWQSVVLGRVLPIRPGHDHLTRDPSSAMLALDGGFPDASLQAHDLLSRFAARLARRPIAWERCLPEGLGALRELLASELGSPFTADDVVVTAGAQSAIATVISVLTKPGEAVVIEDPSYPGAIGATLFAGREPVPVVTDELGVRPDVLAAVLRRTGASMLFLQPRHANPHGAVLATDRRDAVLRVARDANCFIVEDDWVRDLDLDRANPSPPPLATIDPHGHVIYIRSLSKVTAPGMRVAGVIARGPVKTRLRNARILADFFAAPLLQATAAELVVSSEWKRHLDMMRTELRVRRDAAVSSLGEDSGFTFDVPSGGVVLWLRLPERVDEAAVVDTCAARGLRVGAGQTFRLTEPVTGAVRLSFGAAPAAELRLGVARLKEVLAEHAAAAAEPRPQPSNRQRSR